ncbi:helix-turn-helix domain-containing protein [Planomicrobium sp. YIM 101495]|uniref:helix-turn-helix domain-containing protein n=1 Tax=Planomicrobium sp. YIM 101495 TaxID=2665160 RepID=UPI0012B9E437|nr:helix-turn-helix domain-containing protein [Planomicrobium sp. YIM 101495]MTD30217.1 DUF4115 domain-containing protein [Planomicrobium sp. YIM 101495]
MSELGTRLREARVAKGYSLEDLQDVTKIQKRYLAGIEEGNYSMMPGTFYVRAFIKQYAEAVGLNPEEILEQYKSEVPETVKEPVRPTMAAPTPSRRETFSRSSSNRLGEVMPMILVGLFIVVIFAVAWFFYQQLQDGDSAETPVNDAGVQYDESNDEGQDGDGATEEPADVEEEPVKEEEPAQPAATLSVVGTQGETTTYTWSGPETREMVITASGASWVSATDHNQAELMSPARTMQAGDSETIDLSTAEQVRVRLGASGNVTLSINGEPIEYAVDLITQNIIIQFTDVQ